MLIKHLKVHLIAVVVLLDSSSMALRGLVTKVSYFKISCCINFRGVNYITWEDKAKLYQEDEVCFTFCSHVDLA